MRDIRGDISINFFDNTLSNIPTLFQLPIQTTHPHLLILHCKLQYIEFIFENMFELCIILKLLSSS